MLRLLIILIFLASCGRNINYNAFTPFVPENVETIGQKVFKASGLTYSDYSVTFYYGEQPAMLDTCGDDYSYSVGCNFPPYNEIFLDKTFKNQCDIIAHELVHQSLYYKTGDADAEHKSILFQQIDNFCEKEKNA